MHWWRAYSRWYYFGGVGLYHLPQSNSLSTCADFSTNCFEGFVAIAAGRITRVISAPMPFHNYSIKRNSIYKAIPMQK